MSTTDNTKVVSDDTLRSVGFNDQEIQAGKTQRDGFIGEKDGIRYFAAEVDIAMGDFKYQGSTGVVIDQQGEGNNRTGRQRYRD